MSNLNMNEASGTSHNDKENKNTSEQKTDDFHQNKEIDEKLSKSEIKRSTKIEENSINKVDNIGSSSTITKDTKIDLTDKVFLNVSNKKKEQFQNEFSIFQKCMKLGIRVPQQDFLQNQTHKKILVQYSLGQGKGFGKGTGDYDTERNSFVLLVMVIVLVMLLITAGWIILVFTVESLFDTFADASIFSIMAVSVCLLILDYTMTCVPAARKPPCGIFVLLFALIFMCLLAAMVTCRYDTIIVFYAFLATSAIVLVCAALACTPFDFTSCWLYFIVILVGFSVVAMTVSIGMMVTGTYLKTVHLAILCIAVLLQSVGLVMNLQMILGGKSIEIEEDDYLMAAFILYTSIVRMFLNLVQILGLLDQD
ncbi:unnamed protein product [Arctia plantaginis]|uniref:Uncharacterized protein n=1 Tax=Arctia plantaginis TaxID=874455 RepID=A0A8S1A007_ARCPL|nr:unnamed protein product [Arctia plantaginis]